MSRRPGMLTPWVVLLALVLAGVMTSTSARSNGSRSQRQKSSSVASRPAHRSSPAKAQRRTSASVQYAKGRATYGHSRYRPGYHHGYGWYVGHPYFWFSPWWWNPHYSYWGFPGRNYIAQGELSGRTLPLTIETDVKPGRATLSLDGEAIGRAKDFNGNWDLLIVSAGRHALEFNAEGYMSLRILIDAEAGSYLRIKERLQKGDGLDPRSSSGALAVDPAPVAQVGAPTGELRTGFLKIKASPPDAAVYLDGEFLASAEELSRLHGALPMAQGPHLIEVVRPGYTSEELSVVVDGTEPVEVVLALEKRPD